MLEASEILKKLLELRIDYKEFEWFDLSKDYVLISVILTQNTNWRNVLKALENLKKANILTINDLNLLKQETLASLIKPSGFYNTKSKYLKNLAFNIISSFKTLENFTQKADKTWLLKLKGLGNESVDSILNYVCCKEFFVVDKYSQKLAGACGYNFKTYEALQEFFEKGIKEKQDFFKEYFKTKNLYELYQIFHALIVLVSKKYKNLKDFV